MVLAMRKLILFRMGDWFALRCRATACGIPSAFRACLCSPQAFPAGSSRRPAAVAGMDGNRFTPPLPFDNGDSADLVPGILHQRNARFAQPSASPPRRWSYDRPINEGHIIPSAQRRDRQPYIGAYERLFSACSVLQKKG